MITRDIVSIIRSLALQMPVLVITGPRQSGKTTLAQGVFSNYDYVNLELPAERDFAKTDPHSFLERFTGGLIIDEVQYVPELFSYIQIYADKYKHERQYILTGSQNFYLMEAVSQSLAGRAAIFNLLPFSINELQNTEYYINNYEKFILTGFYPRIYDEKISSYYWYQSYIQTYIERDVRQIVNVKNLNQFRLMLKLLAGRIGQVLNINSLANEVGIDNKTIKSWISILETSYSI